MADPQRGANILDDAAAMVDSQSEELLEPEALLARGVIKIFHSPAGRPSNSLPTENARGSMPGERSTPTR